MELEFMKNLKDLKLPKKFEIEVNNWLCDWLEMLKKQANGREGCVHRADFENNDFFYFTDCTDILSKDPEAKGVEDNRNIQLRKRTVMAQLLIKTLLGINNPKKIKCSHCGFEDRYIDALPNGGGHFLYCPKCHYTNICTYPGYYATCIEDVLKIIKKKFSPAWIVEK